MSDIFDRIAEAEELRTTEYFAEGHYIFQLKDALVKKNRHDIDIAIIEGVVVESTNERLARGRNVSWVCKLAGNDVGKRDLKTQIANIIRCPASEVTGDLLRTSLKADPETGVSPLAGTMCYVYAHLKETKTGGSWTKVEFRGIKDGDIIPNFDDIRKQNNHNAMVAATAQSTTTDTFDDNGELING